MRERPFVACWSVIYPPTPAPKDDDEEPLRADTIWRLLQSMLLVNWTFVLQSLSDPFGRGWDFLGTAGMPWHQVWPRGIPWLQALAVLAGFAGSLRNGYRIWREETGEEGRALRGYAPLALSLAALAAGLLFFYTN